MHGETMKN